MARLIKTEVIQNIECHTYTEFEDGTNSVKKIALNDIVEGLRYVENEAILSVTGAVRDMKMSISKVTPVSLAAPVDYFAKDVELTKLVVDASEQYVSNVVTVPVREIVEDAGVKNVTRVYSIAHPIVDLIMTYSNDEVINQSIEVGDILDNVKILTTPGNPDITGNFTVAAFGYAIKNSLPVIDSFYLTPVNGGASIKALIKNIIFFNEVPQIDVTSTDSLNEIATALNLSETGEVSATLTTDITIPTREDGKITTLFINQGQTLDVDFAGHTLSVDAYAFYVNGGTLNITDSTGTGKIEARLPGKAYGVIQVLANGVCNMDGVTIDTTKMETTADKPNWIYGVVCSGNGIFNMNGGTLHTDEAAGISITNGTASGEGAVFTIGGDSVIKADNCSAVYLADNKAVVVKDNAKLYGGIMARMGDITVQDNAYVEGATTPAPESIGAMAAFSGCNATNAAFIGFTGIYGSALGNDMNLVVKDKAVLKSTIGDAVIFGTCNNKYDQKVRADIDGTANVDASGANAWAVIGHDTLAEQAAAAGRNIGPENYSTDLVITIAGEQVYPTE